MNRYTVYPIDKQTGKACKNEGFKLFAKSSFEARKAWASQMAMEVLDCIAVRDNGGL